jgi:hypothetical protein
MAESLGEKTMLATCTDIIKESIGRTDNWLYRQAGYTFLGMISEHCGKSFRKNIQEILMLCAGGLKDEHVRVRYSSLMALGLMLNVVSP